jgi:catechol O-methyltransferase
MATRSGIRTKLPFVRWSFLRMMLGMKKLTTEWQVGDGREEALAQYVVANARAGDLDDAIRAVDEFAYSKSFLINVGDEKGEILDAAIKKASPKLLLELGTYVGYSALRTARAMPDGAHLVSVEFNAANAAIARRVLDHAGAGDRVTVVHGSLSDEGKTVAALESEHGFAAGKLDFAFIDHAKELYLSDLKLIEERGWLHPGSIVVGDNIKFPGVPDYDAYMHEQEGKTWRSVRHEAHAEYQTMLKDIVLESEYLGA